MWEGVRLVPLESRLGTGPVRTIQVTMDEGLSTRGIERRTYANGSRCAAAQAAAAAIVRDAVGAAEEGEVVVTGEDPVLLRDAGVAGPQFH
jgi:hypothetical protein